jgi:uncharacterized protein (TIGR03083 family)
MAVDLGECYQAARERIVDLVMSSGPAAIDQLAVPATPGWRVHDLVAHLRGVVADGLSGNMAGAPGEAWTAAQVERGRDAPLVQLLDEWEAEAPGLEAFLSSPEGAGAGAAVMDVHTHELDLRGALRRPHPLPDEVASWAIARLVEGLDLRLAEAGLDPIAVEIPTGERFGPAASPVVLRAGATELFRACLGRRSASQVAAYDWGGADPSPILPHFFIFGPRTEPLIEDLTGR